MDLHNYALLIHCCMTLFHAIDLPSPEIMAWQKEVKSCSKQVESLQKEFKKLKQKLNQHAKK